MSETNTTKKLAYHNPLSNIRKQQEVLDLGIQQHENEPEIQQALRDQKDKLDEMANNFKKKQNLFSSRKDGGGAHVDVIHHAGGSLSEMIFKKDGEKTKTFTRTINKFDGVAKATVEKQIEDAKKKSNDGK